MVDIHIGAMVENNGEELGRLECIVLDRDSYEATHLVVKQGRALSARHMLMPVEWVTGSDRHRIQIDQPDGQIAELPNFELQHYVSLDQLDEEHVEHPRSKVKPADWINYFVPLFANAFGDPLHTPGVVVTDQLLAPSESAIRRGINVESCDGHRLGEVQEVLLTEPDWGLSGIIITRGFVLKHPMRVPADWVAKIEQERIVLNRSKKQVEDWERQKGR
jgi:sporulation protein YlmC with PRC-barrel domain